ncbi:AIM24 family protein [Chitinophaga sedimenti]|uniref:AIM24 family protein n=1 Tax=Chitinophaga sedimenti TaxID=2033606 RepID=UPI0035560ADB
MDLSLLGNKIICQKDAFLCAAKGVSVGIEFQRKLGTGIFGGEGFIMQKLEGDGSGFCTCRWHGGGKELAPGQVMKLDTGCLVAYTQNIDFDIEFVRGIKNMVFGGEGLFFAVLRGPGKVWVQSLPISRLASRVLAYGGPGGRREEGSILGGLGNLLDGD